MKSGTKKSKKGFTLIELTFVMMTLLSLAAATIYVVITYNTHKVAAEAGQKLQNMKHILRASNALRIPIDAANPLFGTNGTVIEKINNGQLIGAGDGVDLNNPNSMATLSNFMYQNQYGNPNAMNDVYTGATRGGVASINMITTRDRERNLYYMQIIGGMPRFTQRGNTVKYDPTRRENDGMWDAGF